MPNDAQRKIDGYLALARHQGWTVERGAAHQKAIAPNGRTVVVPSSTSDHRAVLNARAAFRRAGLAV